MCRMQKNKSTCIDQTIKLNWLFIDTAFDNIVVKLQREMAENFLTLKEICFSS